MIAAIVKVQIPLFISHPTLIAPNEGLVYDMRRKYECAQALPDRVVKELAETKKGYYEAVFDFITGAWDIGNQVQQQNW